MGRLATVIVFAKDVARMRAFYEGVLGLVAFEEDVGWVRLDAVGCAVALHAIPERFARDIVISDPPAAREDTPIKLAFHVDDVAAERERLVAAGVTMMPLKTFGSLSLCDGLDPEGNVFQISSRAPR